MAFIVLALTVVAPQAAWCDDDYRDFNEGNQGNYQGGFANNFFRRLGGYQGFQGNQGCRHRGRRNYGGYWNNASNWNGGNWNGGNWNGGNWNGGRQRDDD